MHNKGKSDKLTHVDNDGKAKMVDVGGKSQTRRIAIAAGFIRLQPHTIVLVKNNKLQKGDVLAVAKVAAIMAAKKTDEILPLCHQLNLNKIDVTFTINSDGIEIESTVSCTGKTGVEMEALLACSAAALTIYDMCKAADKEMVIENIRLLQKEGGRSGPYKRNEP